jgi:dTDP-4-dehydrorhamnose reductase
MWMLVSCTKLECLFGNAALPGIIAQACETAKVPWGHVSSGCIYTGARLDGSGFTEDDAPNFTFRQNNCSFYSGTKALGEEVLAPYPNIYIWRVRIPFDEFENARPSHQADARSHNARALVAVLR